MSLYRVGQRVRKIPNGRYVSVVGEVPVGTVGVIVCGPFECDAGSYFGDTGMAYEIRFDVGVRRYIHEVLELVGSDSTELGTWQQVQKATGWTPSTVKA